MVPLKKWWLTQASLDIAKDPELLDLMRDSGCIGVFFGIESFGAESLREAHKRQNKVAEYQTAVDALHRRGIAVMAGFIAGFDGDSPASIVDMAQRLEEIGIDVPFLSVLTPYKGTPLFDRLAAEDRLLPDRGWQYSARGRCSRETRSPTARPNNRTWAASREGLRAPTAARRWQRANAKESPPRPRHPWRAAQIRANGRLTAGAGSSASNTGSRTPGGTNRASITSPGNPQHHRRQVEHRWPPDRHDRRAGNRPREDARHGEQAREKHGTGLPRNASA